MTKLADILQRALHDHPHGDLGVAYSGGPDSTALVHALAQLPQARARNLRALHVDHGLHPDSAAWAAHCQQQAHAWQVPCLVLPVEVDRTRGHGLEAAAREARYRAFAMALHEGERLVLGHHRDDQAETVLLKLLRGAGPEGLGGMRAQRPLGRGLVWRPLLDVPRAVLRDYVAAHQLPVIDDPSNTDSRLSRNFLRHTIVPRLEQHWPHAVASITHSARHSRQAADALAVQWRAAQRELLDPSNGSMDAAGWLALPPAWRHPLLDDWLHTRGLSAPTTAQREQIERQCSVHDGQQPCICWANVQVRVWKGRLWASLLRPQPDPRWQAHWQGEPLSLPDGGRLWLEPAGRLGEPLTVRLRQGGERLRPAGDRHTRELRDLFQQSGLPPWQRAVCPLLYAAGELIGAGDRWLTERGVTLFRAANASPRWQIADPLAYRSIRKT